MTDSRNTDKKDNAAHQSSPLAQIAEAMKAEYLVKEKWSIRKIYLPELDNLTKCYEATIQPVNAAVLDKFVHRVEDAFEKWLETTGNNVELLNNRLSKNHAMRMYSIFLEKIYQEKLVKERRFEEQTRGVKHKDNARSEYFYPMLEAKMKGLSLLKNRDEKSKEEKSKLPELIPEQQHEYQLLFKSSSYLHYDDFVPDSKAVALVRSTLDRLWKNRVSVIIKEQIHQSEKYREEKLFDELHRFQYLTELARQVLLIRSSSAEDASIYALLELNLIGAIGKFNTHQNVGIVYAEMMDKLRATRFHSEFSQQLRDAAIHQCELALSHGYVFTIEQWAEFLRVDLAKIKIKESKSQLTFFRDRPATKNYKSELSTICEERDDGVELSRY